MGISIYPKEKQIEIALEYLMDSNSEAESIGKKYGISARTVQEYATRHQDAIGSYLKSKRKVAKYSADTKNLALDALRNGVSVDTVASTYKIKLGTVKRWKSSISKGHIDDLGTTDKEEVIHNIPLATDSNNYPSLEETLKQLGSKITEMSVKLDTLLSMWE